MQNRQQRQMLNLGGGGLCFIFGLNGFKLWIKHLFSKTIFEKFFFFFFLKDFKKGFFLFFFFKTSLENILFIYVILEIFLKIYSEIFEKTSFDKNNTEKRV